MQQTIRICAPGYYGTGCYTDFTDFITDRIDYGTAVKIRDLMLSPSHQDVQWDVEIRKSSPKDDRAIGALSEAMSANIGQLSVTEDCSHCNDYHFDIVRAVFQPPTFDRISKSIKKLRLKDLKLDEAHFSMIKTWLGNMEHLESVHISTIEAIGVRKATVINGLLHAIKQKPDELDIEFSIKSLFFAGDPLLLPMDEWGHLKKLKIKHHSFWGLLDVSCFKNLQDLRLSFGIYRTMDSMSILYLQTTVIDTMLADSSCCLETLHMPLNTDNEEFIQSFFSAVQNNKKLKIVKTFCHYELNATIQCEVLKLIAVPTNLHGLHLDIFPRSFSPDAMYKPMADILSNHHTKLEIITVGASYPYYVPRAVVPYLRRNKVMNNLLAFNANCPIGIWCHVLGRMSKMWAPYSRIRDALFQVIRDTDFIALNVGNSSVGSSSSTETTTTTKRKACMLGS